MDDLGRSGSSSVKDAWRFEHFNVFTTRCCRIAFWKLWTRTHENIKIMSSVRNSVQRPGSEVRGGVVGASAMRRRKCVKKMRGSFCVIE